LAVQLTCRICRGADEFDQGAQRLSPAVRARLGVKETTLVAKPGKPEVAHDRGRRLPRRVYERELRRLQAQLVMLQEWVRAVGARLVVVFEGRDAAGKGSTIKRVTVKQPGLYHNRNGSIKSSGSHSRRTKGTTTR
jgi:Polyphosphate kinase 2 (PPK2)